MKKLLEQEKSRKSGQINRLTVGNAIAGKLLVMCPEIVEGTVKVNYSDDRDVMQAKEQSRNLTAWAILLSFPVLVNVPVRGLIFVAQFLLLILREVPCTNQQNLR